MILPSQVVSRFRRDIDAIIAEDSVRSSVISEVQRQQSQGQPLDAQAFLVERPDLGVRKEVVLELAYAEYCQRIKAGESVDKESFCKRFSPFELSVCRHIEVNAFLHVNPGLLPAVVVDWPEPDQEFAGFSIRAKLGQGTFARVFVAEEIALGRRPVAIKVSVDGTLEAKILGRLQHPNIVPVYSVRQDADTRLTVVCMPYLGRKTLFDVLDGLFGEEKRAPTRSRDIIEVIRNEAIRDDEKDTMPTGDAAGSIDGELYHGSYVDGALHLGSQLAEALAYSHSRGIRHGDLKPSNVMVTPGGRPMLLDFNLAFDSQAMDGRLGGTLPYMAPEQLRAMGGAHGAQGVVGERSDIFSLGVILYELLSGTRPFGPIATDRPIDEIRASLLKRQSQGPRRLRRASKQVDPRLARIVESCLAFSADQRPQCAGELADALRASRSTSHRVERWARRNWLLAVGGMVCCSVAGIAAGHHLLTRDPYEIRMFNSGGQAYATGHHIEAEEYFKLVTDEYAGRVPTTVESRKLLTDALLWHGRACLELGRGKAAVTSLGEAAKLDKDGDGRIFAFHAYVCAREDIVSACMNRSRQAITAGFGTAEVRNNLGYAHLLEHEFDLAIENLDQAIQSDSGLRPAYYNRALAESRRAPRRGPVDPQARIDIERVLEGGSENAYVYYDAAQIYFRLGGDPDCHRKRVVDCLVRALQLGASQKAVCMNFPSLVSDPSIQKALAQPVKAAHRSAVDQLADPLHNQPFPFRQNR